MTTRRPSPSSRSSCQLLPTRARRRRLTVVAARQEGRLLEEVQRLRELRERQRAAAADGVPFVDEEEEDDDATALRAELAASRAELTEARRELAEERGAAGGAEADVDLKLVFDRLAATERSTRRLGRELQASRTNRGVATPHPKGGASTALGVCGGGGGRRWRAGGGCVASGDALTGS